MEKRDNPVQPLGICQRIFNFFVNSLIPRGLKRITLGPAVPDSDDRLGNEVVGSMSEQQPSSVSLEKRKGEGKVEHQAEVRRLDVSGHEIQVHFKQTEEELDHWTPVDELGFSVHEAKKENPIIDDGKQSKLKNGRDNILIPVVASNPSSGQKPDKMAIKKRSKVTERPLDKEELPLVQVKGITGGTSPSQVPKRVDDSSRGKGSEDATTRGKDQRAMEPHLTVAQGRGPKKVISIQEHSEEDKAKKKGKEIAITNEQLAPPLEPEQPIVRFPVHLISVASNINAKSAAFIESQKAAMRRNLSLESKKT